MTKRAKKGKQQVVKPLAVPPLGDPATGVVIVTLADGVARRMALNVGALLVLEEALGVPFYDALTKANVLELLYAGTNADAVQRGEKWSPKIAADLVSVEVLMDVAARVRWAQMVALQKMSAGVATVGESQANAGNGTGPQK